jgi:hypothetical protein
MARTIVGALYTSLKAVQKAQVLMKNIDDPRAVRPTKPPLDPLSPARENGEGHGGDARPGSMSAHPETIAGVLASVSVEEAADLLY